MEDNVKHSLPQHIIEAHILPRLPAKSLTRFKCVSKSFLTRISSSKFINLHRKLNNNYCLFVPGQDYYLESFNFDSSSHVKVKLPPLTNANTVSQVDVVGLCHGVLCLIQRQNSNQIILLNLSTRTIKQVPPHPMLVKWPRILLRVGFGFDDVSQDYKLVCYCLSSHPTEINVLVYALNTDTWRVIKSWRVFETDLFTPTLQLWSLAASGIKRNAFKAAVLNDHLLHWPFDAQQYSLIITHDGYPYVIDCFDLCTEKWTKLPCPRPYTAPSYDIQLDIIDGCLCLTADLLDEGLIEIWMMKEYGVKDSSWVLLCGFSKIHDLDCDVDSWISPIAFGNHEILLCQHHSSKFYWYNMSQKSYTEVDIHEVPPKCFSLACVYKESLLALPGSMKHEA